ncbi:hypothetical protein [Pseudarthrobacter sp. ATCC 49987]|uniref:hypothetical protein n=1 Tax=Pseudarthrobacter sp. ATCC 49987 TaxID=2698204 RepID=UPI00136DA2E0|nr:hypothetical protein [Pseudarthrobacter sp. ATCC 49987]
MGVTVTGTITTQNLNPTTGTATPGSFVKLADKSSSTYREPVDSVSVQVTGTYTGVLTPQVSNDGATWVAVGPDMVFNFNTGVYSETIASAAVGVFLVTVGGAKYFRISADAVVTGSATVTINAANDTRSAGVTGSFTLRDKIAGEDLLNDVLKAEDRSSYVNTTASVLVKTGAGRLKGIFVASGTTPTIKLWDSTTAASTVLINTFTPAVGTYYAFPSVEFATGLFITVSGTIDCTVFFK